MKKLLLITLLIPIFFPLMADASQAVHGADVKLIPIDAIGPAIAIGAVGTYYATKDNPEVGKLKDNAQSVYQKSNYAKKIATGVLSSAYQDFYSSDAGGVYAGVPAYVGAKLSDVVDYVKKKGSSAYSYLSGIIDDFTSDSPTFENPLVEGDCISVGGNLYSMTSSFPASSGINWPSCPFNTALLKLGTSSSGCPLYYKYSGSSVFLYKFVKRGSGYNVFTAILSKVVSGVPVGLAPPVLNVDAIADAIDTGNRDFRNEIRDILANLPKSQVQVSDAVSADSIKSSAPPVLDSAQLKQIAQNISQDVSNQLADDLQAIADANPTSLEAQIEAEKAKAEAKEKGLEDQIEKLDNPASIPAVEWGVIDFAPLLVLKNSFNSHAPFSWLSDIGTSWNALTATPIAPSMHIDLGMTEFNLSLSRFDNVASLIRSVMSMILVFGTTWLIIKRFGDM